MTKKFAAVIICFSILSSIIPQSSFGLIVPPDIGTGPQVPADDKIAPCTGPWWAKIACIANKVARYMRIVNKITTALDYIPHQFPFGGPILSSERACGFHFRSTTWIGVPPTPLIPYFWFFPATFSKTVSLAGRAIVVGPPVPTYPKPANPFTFSGSQVPPGGWVIAFPWISKIYDQHAEKRAGPWALGLGFSPFPLDDINDALSDIRIWIPPVPIDRDCLIPDPTWLGAHRVGPFEECIDRLSFECLASGEKDPFGNDIYKVIRLLGTSDENAPASAFPPGFTLP